MFGIWTFSGRGRRTLAWAAVLIAMSYVSTSEARQGRGQASEPEYEHIRDLCDGAWDHGIPRSRILALGTTAVPLLARAMRDETPQLSGHVEGRWRHAARAIGVLGDTSYFDTLMVFIWHRFDGEVNRRTLGAMNAAQRNLTGMAGRSSRVTDYLIRTSSPAAWASAPWRLDNGLPADYVAQHMARASLWALAHVDSEPAHAYIESLKEEQAPWLERGAFPELRRISREVRQKGTDKVWAEEERESIH